MIGAADIRNKRVTARIPGHVLCRKLGFSRGYLSEVENGHISLPVEELAAIDVALEELIAAKAAIRQAAAKAGWPGGIL